MAVIISNDLRLTDEFQALLDHPRILWDDVLRQGTLAASTETAGSEAQNVVDGLTWDHWMPTELPATLEVELDEAVEVDCALIAGHDLGDFGATAQWEYNDGSDWVAMTDGVLPGDNRVTMWLFEAVTSNRFRLYIDGPADATPSIAIAMLGPALVMERKLWRGHVPITLAKQTTVLTGMSEGGQTLGRSVLREGVEFPISFDNLSQQWIRDEFLPFMDSAVVWPFGWAWRPETFPDECGLVWLPETNIKPINTGPADLMSVSFSVRGIVN